MSSLKRAARAVIKAFAGIAVLVFFVANPVGDNSGLLFIASILVLVACGLAWALLEVFGGADEEAGESSQAGQ
jgi:hypothetical protein